MNLSSKKSLSALIIGISLLSILIRLFYAQHMSFEVWAMDYYGYIELAKNIFHRLDFTVRWEIDSPMLYPPFFSILMYLVTYLTKSFVASIIGISIVSAGLYIIPLFFMVRNILNTYSAILAVIFTTYYFGLGPCYVPHADYFYSFLVMIICYFIWDILAHRCRHTIQYFWVGILIGFAYLTKFSGILFCFAGMASILYYFIRNERDIKAGLKMSGALLLGVAPLFIAYHLLLYPNIKEQGKVPNISTNCFFDGNYTYEGKASQGYRDMKMFKLNPQATEFLLLPLLKTTNESAFFLKHPSFVFHKYIWGLNNVLIYLSSLVYPLTDGIKNNNGVICQCFFLYLLIIGGLYFKWDFRLMHVLFFTTGILFTSFYLFNTRYLMPFIPLYFVLWLFILNAFYLFIKDKIIKSPVLCKNIAIGVFICLILGYSLKAYSNGCRTYCAWVDVGQNESWIKAAEWIKNDSKGLPKRAKIMSSSDYISYLTDSAFIMLPFTSHWDKIIDFAVFKNVNYIVLDGGPLGSSRFLDDELMVPMPKEALIRMVKARTAIDISATASPMDAWNDVLEYRDLYEVMPVWPYESIGLIHQLEQGGDLSVSKLRRLNSGLINFNYPSNVQSLRIRETHWMYFNIGNVRSPYINLIHIINANGHIIYIIKI